MCNGDGGDGGCAASSVDMWHCCLSFVVQERRQVQCSTRLALSMSWLYVWWIVSSLHCCLPLLSMFAIIDALLLLLDLIYLSVVLFCITIMSLFRALMWCSVICIFFWFLLFILKKIMLFTSHYTMATWTTSMHCKRVHYTHAALKALYDCVWC